MRRKFAEKTAKPWQNGSLSIAFRYYISSAADDGWGLNAADLRKVVVPYAGMQMSISRKILAGPRNTLIAGTRRGRL